MRKAEKLLATLLANTATLFFLRKSTAASLFRSRFISQQVVRCIFLGNSVSAEAVFPNEERSL
jgi:hypothetical protein